MLFDYISLAGGLVVLIIAGDVLVRGSVGIAQRLGIPNLVIGLTIVAFGTSAPELVISLKAALEGAGSAMDKIVKLEVMLKSGADYRAARGAEFDECIENIDIGGPAMIRAAARTGISRTSIRAACSNKSVNPLPSRAHGTVIRLTPCSGQTVRGILAVIMQWCWKKFR